MSTVLDVGGLAHMPIALALLIVCVVICSGMLLELAVLPVAIDVRRFGVAHFLVVLRSNVVDAGGAFAGVDMCGVVVSVVRFGLGIGGKRSLPILARSVGVDCFNRLCIFGICRVMSSWIAVMC